MPENENYQPQKQPNGFLEFLKRIWSAKITFAVTFAAMMIVIPTVMATVLNGMRASYSVEVLYNFPGAANSRYVDGTIYNYRNNVSYQNLLQAKDSDETFSSIDVYGMSLKGDVSVLMVEEKAFDSSETITTSPAHLVYTVKQKYFASFNQARGFLEALVEIPSQKALEIAEKQKYDYAIEMSKTAISYDSQLDYLESQFNTVNEGYTGLLSNYSNSVTYYTKTGESRLVYESYLTFRNYFASRSISTLRQVLEGHGFVKPGDTSAKVEAEASITEIDRIIEQNTMEIDALTDKYLDLYKGGSTTGVSPFADRIQALITENTALTKKREYLVKKIDHIDGSVTEEEKKEQEQFDALIATTSTALLSFTEEYTTVKHSVDSKTILTTYADSSHMLASGAFAWYVCVLAGAGVGLILGIVIAYFKGVSNYEKEQKIA